MLISITVIYKNYYVYKLLLSKLVYELIYIILIFIVIHRIVIHLKYKKSVSLFNNDIRALEY